MAAAAAADFEPRRQSQRVVIFGTHPRQFNGYSKVVYELCLALTARSRRSPPGSPSMSLHVFGFQNFHNHPGHRLDVPIEVEVFDPHPLEPPGSLGFGVTLVRAYVERVRPDVCIVFNDLIVATSIMAELKRAANRATFRVVAYVDQVYPCQRPVLLKTLDRDADAAIAFTPEWRQCLLDQGVKLPCSVLWHGLNPTKCFPIPRHLARRFYGISDSDFLVLNLNRNQPRKRWDTCMQAFAEVVARRPDAPIKLVIATATSGAWDLLEIFRRELKKRGVDENVGLARLVVSGHAQELTDEETNVLLNLADVGINTCDGEGFGLCNFEHAALGVPQIVPRLGGFLHYLDDSCATLIDPFASSYVDSGRDGVGGEAQLTLPEDYSDAILRYYDDAELRKRHGRAARERIMESRFTWDHVAGVFEDIVATVGSAADVFEEVVATTDASLSEDDETISETTLAFLKGSGEEVGMISQPPQQRAASLQGMHTEIVELRRRLDELAAGFAVTGPNK